MEDVTSEERKNAQPGPLKGLRALLWPLQKVLPDMRGRPNREKEMD